MTQDQSEHLRKSNPKRTVAIAALVTVMAVWGSTFVVTKHAMQELSPLALAFLRFAIASLCLLILMRGWQRVAQLRRSVSIWRMIFLALTGFAFFTAAFNYALMYGSASQGALIYATSPAVVAVCGTLFLKERLHPRSVFGIALSIGGAVTIVLGGAQRLESAPAPILGAVLMLWTVVLWVRTPSLRSKSHTQISWR